MKKITLQHLALSAAMVVISLSIVDRSNSYSSLYVAIAASLSLAYRPKFAPYLIVLWSVLTLNVQVGYYSHMYMRYSSVALVTLLRIVPFALLWIFGKLRPREVGWPSYEAWYVTLLTLIGFKASTLREVQDIWYAAEHFTGVGTFWFQPAVIAWSEFALALLLLNVLILPAILARWLKAATVDRRREKSSEPLSPAEQMAWTVGWGLILLLFAMAPWSANDFARPYEFCLAVGMALVVVSCLSALAVELRERRFSKAVASLVLIGVGEVLLLWVVLIPLQVYVTHL